jgi:hypothetical protein
MTFHPEIIRIVFITGIPIRLISVLRFGWTRKKRGFTVIFLPLFILRASVILYAWMLAAQYRGFGSTESSPWDGSAPPVVIFTFGALAYTLGIAIRSNPKN